MISILVGSFIAIIGLLSFMFLLGIFSIFLDSKKNKKKESKKVNKNSSVPLSSIQKMPKTNEKLEKEMDLYGLTPEEKEVCRQGYYEPFSFEEDESELEEDDYYHDSD